MQAAHSASLASVVRVVVESDGDVEFLDNSRPPFFGNAATSKLLPKEPVVSWYPGHPPSVAKVGICEFSCSYSFYFVGLSGSFSVHRVPASVEWKGYLRCYEVPYSMI